MKIQTLGVKTAEAKYPGILNKHSFHMRLAGHLSASHTGVADGYLKQTTLHIVSVVDPI